MLYVEHYGRYRGAVVKAASLENRKPTLLSVDLYPKIIGLRVPSCI